MMEFECDNCGICCNPGQVDKDADHFIPVYLDEVEGIKQLAMENNLEIQLAPDIMYYDELNNRLIIATYALQLNDGSCPFYQSNCSIYESRPITCKAYPLSIFRSNDTTGLTLKPECTFIQQNATHFKSLDFYEMSDVFSDEFPESRQIQIMGNAITSQIMELESENNIKVPVKFPVELTEETRDMNKIRLDAIK